MFPYQAYYGKFNLLRNNPYFWQWISTPSDQFIALYWCFNAQYFSIVSIQIYNHWACLSFPNENSSINRPACTINPILKSAQRFDLLSGWKWTIAFILIKFPNSDLSLWRMSCNQISSVLWSWTNAVRSKLELWFFEERVKSSILRLPYMSLIIRTSCRNHKRIWELIHIFQEIPV